MADLIVVEHNHNRRFNPDQTTGKKPHPLSSGDQNGHSNRFSSLLGEQHQSA